ncbi:hypothetical protein CCUS01_07695 [Colletotrichum cuscutae]|uniref:Uncharacterized protein n=1 Tax=Colletotrichum cuscutae TaxID=1209917 RepID=A0AAI9XZL8_9PEZI|nr:hypothetical protein CCUS01_07695 [Colletotrichum cuscutae]
MDTPTVSIDYFFSRFSNFSTFPHIRGIYYKYLLT